MQRRENGKRRSRFRARERAMCTRKQHSDRQTFALRQNAMPRVVVETRRRTRLFAARVPI